MMRRLLLSILLMCANPAFATQESVALINPMVADISQNAIEIRSSFNGTQLLIFGARNVPGELAIVVRGPAANVQLRRKERIAGMWMHMDQHKYAALPLFYALASTRPLEEVAPPTLLQTLGLGEDHVIRASNRTADAVFDQAIADTLISKRWWQAPAAKITYFGESLFKARLDLPDTLPRGNYTAEVYLFDRNRLLGFQTIPLIAYKTGMDARIYDAAHQNAVWYGMICVLMALFGGWLAHRLFHK